MGLKKIIAMTLTLGIVTMFLPAQNILANEKNSLENSLKGYWNFEEFIDKTIIDSSGNEKHGTINGNAIIVNEGINNQGLKLSGEKGTFLRIPSIFNMSKENISISFWINISKDSKNRADSTILIQQEGNGRSILTYSQPSVGDKLGSFVGGINSYSNKKLEQGSWYNITMNSNFEDKKIKFYINGELDSIHSIAKFDDTNDFLRIGDHKNASGLALNGIVDELMIFNRCLSNEEIKNIYQRNVSVDILIADLEVVITEAQKIYNQVKDFINNSLLDDFKEEIKLAQEIAGNKDLENNIYIETADKLKKSIDDIKNLIDVELGDTVYISAGINDIVRSIDTSIFGANHRYHKNGYGSYDVENLKMKNEFDKLYDESNFGAIRYPGGKVANLFEWKRSIGDISKRKNTIHGDPEQVPEFPYFGLDEAARYAEEKNSEFIYVYNLGNGNKQDAADLVEYLNCEVGENPNGGIDWAKVRADNGRVEPYDVTHFELGNEFQLHSEQGYWINNSNDKLGAYIDGGEFTFTNQLVVEEEDWRSSTAGKSNGERGQKKMIRYFPIVENTLTLKVGDEIWERVDSLNDVGNRNVYIYDNNTGKIIFGDGKNGNIPKKGNQIRVTYNANRDGYNDYYNEIKKVDPNVKLYSSYENQSFIDRMGTENAFDGIVIHPYSGTINSSDSKYYEKILYRAEEKLQSVKSYEDKIKSVLGEEKAKDVKVVVSEYGIFNDSSRYVKSQINALYTAKSMIGFADIESVPYATKHCLVDFPVGDLLGPGQQAIIQSIKNEQTGEIEFVATPSAKVFTLFNNFTGTQVLNESTINNKELNVSGSTNLNAIDSMITKDNFGNLYVMFVNASKEDVDIKLNIDGFDFTGKNAKIMTVDGPTYDAENTLDNKDNVIVEESNIEKIENNDFSYKLTPHSVTAIRFSDNKLNISKPLNLKSESYSNYVELTWEKPINNIGLVEYAIYKDGKQIANVPANKNNFKVKDLKNDTIYGLKVIAVYANGKNSKPTSITVRTDKYNRNAWEAPNLN